MKLKGACVYLYENVKIYRVKCVIEKGNYIDFMILKVNVCFWTSKNYCFNAVGDRAVENSENTVCV